MCLSFVLAEIMGSAHATVQKFVSPYIRVDPNVGVGLRQHVHISMGKCGLHYGQVRSKAKDETRSANGTFPATFPSMDLHGYS